MTLVYHIPVLKRKNICKGVHKMSSEIEAGMATMFREATMKSVVLALRKPADWDRFNRIENIAKQKEKEESESFKRDKPILLAAARKDLIDKAGSLTFEHPAPFGTDKFDKDAIERQAIVSVVNNHQARLLGIKTEETNAFEALRQDIHAREGVSDIARDAFARSTDRRDGEERRIPIRNR